jgi:hypothetical protein
MVAAATGAMTKRRSSLTGGTNASIVVQAAGGPRRHRSARGRAPAAVGLRRRRGGGRPGRERVLDGRAEPEPAGRGLQPAQRGGYIKNLNADQQEQPLAEEWNGTSWTQLAAPNPHAENGSELTSVSCVSASACETDGDYDYADVAQSVFGYGWNGTTWTAQKQVNPSGQMANSDNSVSCTSASACTSAGSWTSIGLLGLAERWNGTAWSRQTVPTPAKAVTDELVGVDCATATACTAVGDSSTSYQDTTTAPMVMTWNGKSWQLATTPAITGGGGLRGVSCIAPATCVAVGVGNGTSTLVEASPAG